MMLARRWFAPFAFVALAVLAGTAAVQAAAVPAVKSVSLGRDEVSGRTTVVLEGTLLTRITGYTLLDALGAPVPDTVEVVYRSKSRVVVLLPAGLGGQEYDLTPALKVGSLPALHLRVEDGVLFRGNLGSGTIPSNNVGDRMMWYPGKAAFRAGCAFGQSWNDVNVGLYSFACGSDTKASGSNAFAAGVLTAATGDYSTALGASSAASGFESLASGESAVASGSVSTALGMDASASGDHATALGEWTQAQAFDSVVLGRFNVPAGSTTTWVATDPVLVVGNGANGGALSNAFTLLKNGNLTIQGTLTEASDARRKTDVRTLEGVLPRLAAVRAVSYRIREDAGGPAGPQIGFLAQEVRAAFPELVQEDSGGSLSVAYGKFTAVLLEAVKEQQAALDARDAEIAALRKELAVEKAATERRLARLEALLAK